MPHNIVLLNLNWLKLSNSIKDIISSYREEEMKKLSIFILASAALLIAGCSSTTQLTSTSVPGKIDINGDASDWGTSLKYLPDEKVAIGVSNDNDYLYLCLASGDMSKIMPMFAGSFVVWVENENKNDNTIGIKYPLHNIVNESRIMINPGEFQEKGRGMMISKMIKDQDEIRILNKDNFPLTVISVSDSSGLTARLGYNNDQFIYELRVPLKVNEQNQYGINADPGEKLLIKFETEKPDRKNFGGREGQEGNRPGGGMGGFPGGNRGGGMGPEGGGRRSFEPVDFSVEVTLK